MDTAAAITVIAAGIMAGRCMGTAALDMARDIEVGCPMAADTAEADMPVAATTAM
jgi:hypothetical protein